MALPIEFALCERTRLVSSYSGCLSWVNESQCFTYLICEVPDSNRAGVVIKSGVYAKILTLNDELHCWCMMGRACNAECIPTYICFQPDRLVLQMQLNSLRCVCVCVGGGNGVLLSEHLDSLLHKLAAYWYMLPAALELFHVFRSHFTFSYYSIFLI